MSNIDDDQKTRFQPKRAVPEGTTVASPSHRATPDRAVPKPVPDDRTRFAPRSKAASQVPNTADGRTVVKPSRKPAAGPAQDKTRIHSSTAVGDQLRSQSQPNQRPAPTAAPYGVLKNRFAREQILRSEERRVGEAEGGR